MGATEAASKLDWPSIIKEAAASQLGIIALIVLVLVLGAIAIAFFHQEKDPRYKLTTLVLLLVGFGGLVFSVKEKAASAMQIQNHATQRYKVCAGNGGGPSCANGVDAYYTCDEYDKIGGGGPKTQEILVKQFCEYTEDGKLQIAPSKFIHNISVGGGQCGWTSFTVICNP